PVNLVAVAATLLVLWLYFRRDIPLRYATDDLQLPALAVRDRATFRAGWVVLVVLLAALFVLEPLGIPVSAVASACAAVLFAVAAR
ncbi:ArsB/NhaD family transporter, partial [Pseudoalteromonas sp. SIMBA_162]